MMNFPSPNLRNFIYKRAVGFCLLLRLLKDFFKLPDTPRFINEVIVGAMRHRKGPLFTANERANKKKRGLHRLLNAGNYSVGFRTSALH